MWRIKPWMLYAAIFVTCMAVNAVLFRQPVIDLIFPPVGDTSPARIPLILEGVKDTKMPDTGNKTPTASSQAGTGTDWTSLSNAFSADSQYVECQSPIFGFSKELWLTGFDFSSIPAGKQIDGIEVTLSVSESEDYAIIVTSLAQLVYGGSLVGTPKSESNHWYDFNPVIGGATDKWGLDGTLTVDYVQSSGFGIAIKAEKQSYDGGEIVIARLDTAYMRIYYSDVPTEYGTADGTLPGMYGSGQGKIIGSGSAVLPGLTGKAHHRVN